MDLILTMSGIGSITILRNDGRGEFFQMQIYLGGGTGMSVRWADLDLDGNLDLVLPGHDQTGNLVPKVYFNELPTRTWKVADTSVGKFSHTAVEVADMNEDGFLDIFLCGVGKNMAGQPLVPASRLFLNDGTGQFSEFTQLFDATDATSVSAPFETTFFVEPVVDVEEPELSIESGEGGRMEFSFHGEPRQRYLLEISSDLRQWTPYFGFESRDGALRFEDPFPAGDARFYRLRPVD